MIESGQREYTPIRSIPPKAGATCVFGIYEGQKLQVVR